MPPKRDGGKSTRDLPTDSDNTDNLRNWTGRPVDKPMWFNVNKKLLFDEVKGARDLITKGVVISEKQGIVFVNNVNHAQAYIMRDDRMGGGATDPRACSGKTMGRTSMGITIP